MSSRKTGRTADNRLERGDSITPGISVLPGVSIGHMPTPPKNAVVRLGELLTARMGRNSRLSLYEALVDGGRVFEPDAELVGHLIHHRRELSSWMQAVKNEEPRGPRWEESPQASLRGLLVPWLQVKNQFFHVDEETSRQLEALYRRAIADAAHVLSSRTDDVRALSELRGVWEAHRERLASFARVRLGGDLSDTVCRE